MYLVYKAAQAFQGFSVNFFSPSFGAKLENAHTREYSHRTIIAHPSFLQLG